MKALLLLVSIVMVSGCQKVGQPYIGIEDTGDDDRVPSVVKSAVESTNIINPTGLQLELKMITVNGYKQKDGVHQIMVKAGPKVTEWTVSVSKKNAHNIDLNTVMLVTTPELPGDLVARRDASAGGVRSRYAYKVDYKADKGKAYREIVYIKARDIRYCRDLVKQLNEGIDLEKVNGIAPSVTEETTARDCADSSHTFNFDQTLEVELRIDNDNAHALEEQALADDEKAKRRCLQMFTAATALEATRMTGVLDTDKHTVVSTEDRVQDGEVIGKRTTTERKTKWSWVNALRVTAQVAVEVFNVYTRYKSAQEGIHLDCEKHGFLTSEQVKAIGATLGK